MSSLKEIAPFFTSTTNPAIIKDAQGILQSLKGGVYAWTGQQRPALAAISALLACERHGQPLVSQIAAQKASATSPTVFALTLRKCRELLPSTSSTSASGRKSMASPRASTSRASTTPVKNTFDPLNLPGSSAKKVAPIGRRVTRDLSDFRKKSGATPVKDAPTTATSTTPKEAPTIATTVASASTEKSQGKRKAPPSPSPSAPLVPPRSPSKPPPTPQTPSKTRPTSATGRASLAASPTPRRLAGRTPTGHGSPMHTNLMKGRIEQASAVRLAGGRGKERALEEEEEEEVTSPSKRQKTGPVSAAKAARKGVDLVEVINSPAAHAPTALAERATVSAHKINSLFHPLPSFPLDPYTIIPQPPLVFSGPSIFYAPTLAQGRVAAKMVPPDDIAWGDPYSLMSSRRRGQGSLSVLAIEVGQVGEACAKRERARKRRSKRLDRLESGFATGEGAEWDREFGVPRDVGVDVVDDGADWQERLDLYHAKIPQGLHATIDALSKRTSDAAPTNNEAPPDAQDRQWITRAESHGIAIRVQQDA